jgi:hypothetical protein
MASRTFVVSSSTASSPLMTHPSYVFEHHCPARLTL